MIRNIGFGLAWLSVVLLPMTAFAGEGLSIGSPAFAAGGAIPVVYTCEGEGTSPELDFSGVPQGTKSLALIVEDPDAPDPAAPKMIWTHWVLYDLPPDTAGLAKGVTELPAGTRHGMNNWYRTGYGAPCPYYGRHRYFFRLYALDTLLPDLSTPTSEALQQAMTGHILAKTYLIGTYQKQ
jgi:Raf kinase inhibitor-like YbhB/YbcL family protein